MSGDSKLSIPPLQGCLFCHSEGTTSLSQGRKLLGFGSDYPVLKCSRCGSTALLDIDPSDPDRWRIRYRRVSRSPRFYYVAVHFDKAGWLAAQDALTISTNGYVQRRRVQQAKEGDLGWLKVVPMNPPPPFMKAGEKVHLALRAVTYQQTPPRNLFGRAEQGTVLDSGKLYVTDRNLHLLGQRRDWTHALDEINDVDYDALGWTIHLNGATQPEQLQGAAVSEQFDPQLVAAVVENLWRIY